MNRLLFLITLLFLLPYSYGQVNEVDSKGRKQGDWVKFYEGTKIPIYIGQFKDDKPVGTFTYYYSNNKVKAIVKHDENSNRSEAYLYHDNKKLMAFGIYINEEKDSVWTHYSPKEEISYRETYKKGKLHGKKTIYYIPDKNDQPTGIVMQEMHFKNGILHGPVNEYFPNGVKKMEGDYKEGRFDGVVHRYHPNGKISEEERWKNKEKHGWWIAYEKDGKEFARRYFYHGKELKGDKLTNHLQECKRKGISPNN